MQERGQAQGGYIGKVNHFGSGERFSIPRLEFPMDTRIKYYGENNTLVVGKRMEKQIELVTSGTIDPSKIVQPMFSKWI